MTIPLRILIVDDDQDVAEALADVLEFSGHQITLAHNGQDAIELFCQQEFDITFMDVMMPGMNGVESFLEIRKIKPNAKVAIMTGYSIKELLKQAVDNGAVCVLHKPFDMNAMSEALQKVEEHKGMVLVADDDPEFCERFREVLEAQNYSVSIARDGQDALDKVWAGGIDVLILDVGLPILDGLEVYLELKKHGASVPTIVVAGEGELESKAFDDLSGSGILTKPVDAMALLAALESLSKEAA